ncbi:HyaD/HybD family hydrogenase maturation endopeptidase [Shewanella sp. GXUN23E]|uniref:HyaD/HybD family hydrogenase maturation endopeptidase n=1 Tax=Shewanella sp. GXUN23E TaxID=3422498 RepID=UPI003D7CE065
MVRNTLILGIGNLLWADEGFGVRAVETLDSLYQFDSHVTLLDGGTQGLYLLQFIEQAQLLVVFDAIDYGLAPGTLKLVEGDDVPSFLGARKMSLHQTGFQEVLALSQMLGHYPEQLLLVGVQPQQLEDYGGSLTPLMRSQITPAIDAALAWLARQGIVASSRAHPQTAEQTLAGPEIHIESYEAGRPDAQAACRSGDGRVLYSQRYDLQYRPHPLEPDGCISCDVDHRGKY